MTSPRLTRLTPETYLQRIRAESARFRAVLGEAPSGARVPACPDWDTDDLLWHLAEVQWFWSRIVGHRPAGPDGLEHPLRPGDRAGLLAAYDAWSGDLVAALDGVAPDEQAWSWAPEQTVGFTLRRQAHEALVHGLDAEQTVGAVTPLDPALAADGVAEALDVMFGGDAPEWGRIEPGPYVVRVDLVDVDVSLWAAPCTFLGTDPESGHCYDGPHVLHVADPGREPDAVVSGTAGNLDAWLWKRSGADGVDVTGDPAAYDAFWAAVSPPID
ncbi:MAG: hypothetical protein CMH83_21940 [Nocardioides sp.]|nr:hypothetical protein [Nocardioides sp.]